MRTKGLFITFEGGEGAGKTTLIHCLGKLLAEQGHPILQTREPGGTKLGEEIRALLLASNRTLSSRAELFLFLAARAQHIQEIIQPAIQKGTIVLCDRFNDSTIAYQGVARGLGAEKVAEYCDFACDGLRPDLTFYLDIDPSIGLTRAGKEHPKDRIESESLAFHTSIRHAFHQLQQKNRDRIYLLDASQPPEQVCSEALKIMFKKWI